MQAGFDIINLNGRIIGNYFFRRHTGGEKIQYHFNRVSHVPDCRFAMTTIRVNSDPFQQIFNLSLIFSKIGYFVER